MVVKLTRKPCALNDHMVLRWHWTGFAQRYSFRRPCSGPATPDRGRDSQPFDLGQSVLIRRKLPSDFVLYMDDLSIPWLPLLGYVMFWAAEEGDDIEDLPKIVGILKTVAGRGTDPYWISIP